jgi:hypothetical protein
MTSGGTSLPAPSAAGGAGEWDKYLDDLERRAGVGGLDGLKYLNLTEAEMRAMSAEECFEAAAVLGALAFKVQRVQNRFAARSDWADKQLWSKFGSSIAAVQGVYSTEERRAVVVVKNPDAQVLEKYRAAADGGFICLNYLPQRLESHCRILTAMGEMKKRRHVIN